MTRHRRSRPRHKRRLAHARSGLMLKDTEECEDYWLFPLPPFSPGNSFKSSAPVVLEKTQVTFNTDWLPLPLLPVFIMHYNCAHNSLINVFIHATIHNVTGVARETVRRRCDWSLIAFQCGMTATHRWK